MAERAGFGRLVASAGASNLADGIGKVALPLVAVAFTRSPGVIAGLEVARTVPWVVGALPVGAVIDRVDRRRAMVLANLARGGLVAVAAVLLGGQLGSIGLLYVVAIGSGIAEVFYDTAAQSLLPSVVEQRDLDDANGRLFAVELGAQEFVGPPVAGALVAVSAFMAFGVAAGLWALAITTLLTIRGQFRPSVAATSSIGTDIGEGLTFLLGHPMLRRLAVMVALTNLATSAVFAVLVLHAVGPDSSLGLTETQYGALFATLAAGSLLGSAAATIMRQHFGRAKTLTLGVAGSVLYIATLAATTNVVAIAVTGFVAGAGIMMWNIITVSYRQRATPDHLLGRLNSAYRLLAWGTRPLGAGLGGIIGQAFGLRAVFIVAALTAVAVLVPNRNITDRALEAH